MDRLAAVFAISLTCTLGTIVVLAQSRPADPASQQAANIDDQIASYFCFERTRASVVDSLRSGQMRLADGCDRVHESALAYCPDYLTRIERTDPAPTLRERIARNLIGHVQSAQFEESGATPILTQREQAAISERVQALQRELAALR